MAQHLPPDSAETTDDTLYLVVFWLSSLTSAVGRTMAANLKPFDVTPLEFGILEHCERHTAGTLRELVQVFPVDASVISRAVQRLVQKGLLTRRRLHSDRRVVRLILTQDAAEVVPQLAEQGRASQAQLLRSISEDECAAFIATARKMLANLS